MRTQSPYITNIREGKHKQYLNRSRVVPNIGAALFLYPALSVYGQDILRVNGGCELYWSKTKLKYDSLDIMSVFCLYHVVKIGLKRNLRRFSDPKQGVGCRLFHLYGLKIRLIVLFLKIRYA